MASANETLWANAVVEASENIHRIIPPPSGDELATIIWRVLSRCEPELVADYLREAVVVLNGGVPV